MDTTSFFNTLFAAMPFLVILAIIVAAVVASWITYTLIWMGVKRGLEEYYGPGSYKGYTIPPSESARDDGTEQPLVRDRRHRSGRLIR